MVYAGNYAASQRRRYQSNLVQCRDEDFSLVYEMDRDRLVAAAGAYFTPRWC